MATKSNSGNGHIGGHMKITLEFKNANLELPKESGEYLCYIDGEWIVLMYSTIHKLFNAYDSWDRKDAKGNSIQVTYWAELPKL